MAKQFTLGKNERLKSRKSIEQLFSDGKRFTLHPYLVYYNFTTPITRHSSQLIQFGVGAGTKNFKKAVDRNKIKRLTREAYRLQKISLQEKLKTKNTQLHLFFIYTAKELPEYNEVYKKVASILKKMDTISDGVK